jgi:CBS domain-containing protein|tara:strand:- start:125 stop:787 length:663 start_codon:yes stop_codon:yes gene_type:complete
VLTIANKSKEIVKKIHIGDLARLRIIEERPKGPVRFQPDTLVSDIALEFKKKNIGSVPIVDREDNLLGVLSVRDIVIKLVAEGRDSDLVEAKEIMRTENLAQAYEHHSIDYAIEQIKEKGVRNITILSKDKKVINFLSLRDFLVAGQELNKNLKKKQIQIVRLQLLIPITLIATSIFMYLFDLFDAKYSYVVLSFALLTIGIATVLTAKKDLDYNSELPD